MAVWLTYFLSYPYTRYILETQSDNIFRKDKHIRNVTELRLKAVNVPGAINGALIPTAVYFMFSCFTTKVERLPISMFAATTLSYPFIVNSYFQDLNVTTTAAKDFMSILLSPNNWRGYSLYTISVALAFIPGLNYLIHELNQIRLALIFGKQNGLNLNTYLDAYKHIKENGNFNRGRALTYIPLTVYNIYVYHRLNKKRNLARLE